MFTRLTSKLMLRTLAPKAAKPIEKSSVRKGKNSVMLPRVSSRDPGPSTREWSNSKPNKLSWQRIRRSSCRDMRKWESQGSRNTRKKTLIKKEGMKYTGLPRSFMGRGMVKGSWNRLHIYDKRNMPALYPKNGCIHTWDTIRGFRGSNSSPSMVITFSLPLMTQQ